MANNAKSVIAQSVYDRFMQQYNDKLEQIETDMALVNKTISDKYTEAGVQCPVDENAEQICTIGNCGKCIKAEQKCKCIAATYFQYGYVHHPGHCYTVAGKCRHDHYRMSFVALEDSTKTYYNDGVCTITYRNVSDCNGKNDCDYKNDENQITFNLTDKSTIEMTHCEAGAGKNPDDGKPSNSTKNIGDQSGKYTHHDRLKIDGEEVVRFNRCIANASDIKLGVADWGVPYRGDGACYWCSVQVLYEEGNGNNSNVKDTNTKDMDYKKAVFYNDNYLK